MPPRRRESPKQRYSVDEMMEIARDTQASKEGKSRRRRSSQPVKQRKSLAFKLAIGALALLVLVVLAVFILNKANALRYASDGFKKDAESALSEIFGHKVTLGEIEVDGQSLMMSDLLLEGGAETPLKDLRMQNITGQLALDALVGSTWNFKSLEAYTSLFSLGRIRPAAGEAGQVVGGGDSDGGSGGGNVLFGLTSSPKAFKLRYGRGRETSIYFGGNETGDRIENTRFAIDTFGAQTDVSGSGGTVFWDRLPGFTLKSYNGAFSSEVFKLERARLTTDGRDEILLDGEVPLNGEGEVVLRGSVDSMEMESLIPSYWGQKLSGVLSATFTLTFPMAADGGPPVLKARIKIRDFILKTIPMLDALAFYTAEPDFNFVEIPIIEADLVISEGAISLGNFEAQRPGLVRLAGDLTISRDDLLDGYIELGIPSAAFDKIQGGRPEFFELNEDGIARTRANISGSSSAPVDDLTPKLYELRKQSGPPLEMETADGLPVAAPGVPRVSPPPKPTPGAASEAVETPAPQTLEEVFDSLINPR